MVVCLHVAPAMNWQLIQYGWIFGSRFGFCIFRLRIRIHCVRCCSSRQTAGTLCDGAESLRHALPRLPHDLPKNDGGGRRGTREEAAAYHPQLGLPQTAEGAGHAPPGGKKIEYICKLVFLFLFCMIEKSYLKIGGLDLCWP